MMLARFFLLLCFVGAAGGSKGAGKEKGKGKGKDDEPPPLCTSASSSGSNPPGSGTPAAEFILRLFRQLLEENRRLKEELKEAKAKGQK